MNAVVLICMQSIWKDAGFTAMKATDGREIEMKHIRIESSEGDGHITTLIGNTDSELLDKLLAYLNYECEVTEYFIKHDDTQKR